MENKLFAQDWLDRLVYATTVDTRDGFVKDMKIYDPVTKRYFSDEEFDKIFDRIMEIRERKLVEA